MLVILRLQINTNQYFQFDPTERTHQAGFEKPLRKKNKEWDEEILDKDQILVGSN